MNEQKRMMLAILLSIGVFFGWQKFYIEPRMQQQQAQQRAEQIAQIARNSTQQALQQASASGQPVSPVSAPSLRPVAFKTLQLPTGEVKLSDTGAWFAGWKLKDYRLGVAADSGEVDLNSVTQLSKQGVIAFESKEFAYLSDVQGQFSEQEGKTLWTYEDPAVRLTRTFSPGAIPYTLDVTQTVEFKGARPNFAFLALQSKSGEHDTAKMDRKLVHWTDSSIHRTEIAEKIEINDVSTATGWVGATDRYFLFAFVPQAGSAPKALVQQVEPFEGRASLVFPVSGQSLSVPLRVYFGPKELHAVRAVEKTLDSTIDFGWFTAFAYPLLRIMKWFYAAFANWGIAIILLTLLVKLLTFPLTYKSMKSMKQMAKLQPQLQKLRERYADDKETLNREMLTLMRTQGYNPAAGCLPILIQMPVFFALYRVLYSSIELYHAPFALWIHDLSAKDPFFVTPILLTGTMYLQQKLTPNTATDPAQAKMLQFMPLIFGVMMVSLPSGLTLYMLVNALASIAQQLILNKKFEEPKVEVLPAEA